MANQTEDLDYMIALSLACEEHVYIKEDFLRSIATATATDDASISSLVRVDTEKDNNDDDGVIVDDIMNMSIGSGIITVDDNADDSAASSADSSFVSVNHEDVSINQSNHDSDGFEFVLNGISSIDEVTIEYIGNCSSITDLQHIIHVLNESKSESSDLIQFARNKLFLQHILKDICSVPVSTLPSAMETESAPKSAPSSNKVTIADIENCCSLTELKEILSKLSQSTVILPVHIQSAKERLEVLHEAFFNDSSDSDGMKENNTDELCYDYDYDYDDDDDNDNDDSDGGGGGSEDDGSNDDKNRDNRYNNDNVGQFDNDASDRCAHALKNLFISSDKEDEDDEIMSDVETKGERPLSQAADEEQAQNFNESSKKILSALDHRGTRWGQPQPQTKLRTEPQAYQFYQKAKNVEERDKLLTMSLAFGISDHEYMHGGDGDGDGDGNNDNNYKLSRSRKELKRYNHEYIENCNSIKELRDIIPNLSCRQDLVASAKKRLQTLLWAQGIGRPQGIGTTCTVYSRLPQNFHLRRGTDVPRLQNDSATTRRGKRQTRWQSRKRVPITETWISGTDHAV